jgi:hypothetical protein
MHFNPNHGVAMRSFLNTILNTITQSFFEGAGIAYPVVNDHADIRSIMRGLS